MANVRITDRAHLIIEIVGGGGMGRIYRDDYAGGVRESKWYRQFVFNGGKRLTHSTTRPDMARRWVDDFLVPSPDFFIKTHGEPLLGLEDARAAVRP